MGQTTLSTFQLRYSETVEKVYNFVFYRTGRDRDLAEDLTSEIFLKALERFESYDPAGGSFTSWIFTIARNHTIDHYRTSRKKTSLDEIEGTLAAPRRDIHQDLDDRERVDGVLAAIDTLPPAQRELLVLKFVNELDNEEIAHILNKKPGTVRVAVHRAILTLKSILS